MGHRILLFCNTDDGPGIAGGLNQCGHDTTICSNTSEALAMVRSHMPTVFLYRANFQDYQVREAIASMALHPVMGAVPIVGLADPLPVREALNVFQSGVSDLIAMPQGPTAISRSLEQLLGPEPGDPRAMIALDQRSPVVIQRIMRYLKSVGGSSAITVDTGQDTAHIAFFSGEIVDASFRDLQDNEAIKALLTLDSSQVWQIQLETLDDSLAVEDFGDLDLGSEIMDDVTMEPTNSGAHVIAQGPPMAEPASLTPAPDMAFSEQPTAEHGLVADPVSANSQEHVHPPSPAQDMATVAAAVPPGLIQQGVHQQLQGALPAVVGADADTSPNDQATIAAAVPADLLQQVNLPNEPAASLPDPQDGATVAMAVPSDLLHHTRPETTADGDIHSMAMPTHPVEVDSNIPTLDLEEVIVTPAAPTMEAADGSPTGHHMNQQPSAAATLQSEIPSEFTTETTGQAFAPQTSPISIELSIDDAPAMPSGPEPIPAAGQTNSFHAGEIPVVTQGTPDAPAVDIETFDEVSVETWEIPAALPTNVQLSPLPAPTPEQLAGLPQPTVLLVDDEPSLLKLYSTLFSKKNWTVHTATDGNEGLYAALEYRPDVIVSDIMMPNLDGWGFLSGMRSDFRIAESKFVLLSCHGEYLDKLNEASAGADAYIAKGTRGTEILKKVNELVSARQQFSAVLHQGLTFTTELRPLGPQFVLNALGACGVSGTLKITNRFGEYRIEHDRGIITNAAMTAGNALIKDEEALLSALCLEDGNVEFFLERLMEAPRINKPFQAIRAGLCESLNSSRNVTEDKLVSENVRLQCKNQSLRDFYVLACPDLVRNLAMELCNGVAPMTLLLKGDVSPVIIESVVKDLLRKGIATFEGSAT